MHTLIIHSERNHNFNHHNVNTNRNDDSKQHDHTYLNHKIVTINQSNMIVDINDGGKVRIEFCTGVIPDILKQKMIELNSTQLNAVVILVTS